MGWIAWIILGGVAGWIASMLTRNNEKMGLIANILVGILGAFAGNFLVSLIGGGVANFGFNLTTFIIAIGGAIVLLLIFNWIRRRR